MRSMMGSGQCGIQRNNAFSHVWGSVLTCATTSLISCLYGPGLMARYPFHFNISSFRFSFLSRFLFSYCSF